VKALSLPQTHSKATPVLIGKEGGGLSRSSRLRRPRSLFLFHPKPEAARVVLVDELNSSLLERGLNFEQS
jgi:hypothetical protein